MHFELQKIQNGHHMIMSATHDLEGIVWWCTTCDPEQKELLEVTKDKFPDPVDAMEFIKSYSDVHTLGEPDGVN